MGKTSPGRALLKSLNTVVSRPTAKKNPAPYDDFNQLNGQHPFSELLPQACVQYTVRELNEGRVAYFNFELAKEMGLIPRNHSHRLTKDLEEKLIEVFSIRIINEYDQRRNLKFENSKIKEFRYMATRYLQLQHKNKKGQTSGDGRSVWNGTVTHRGKIWDVSSRGTGVTRLSPGFVEAGRPLKTGSTKFGYGCGTADIDELISAALMSEIYHRQGINTERVLTVLDLGNGLGIGVRASKNLFRPAHLFALLKQGRRKPLEKATDYVISRQVQNKRWKIKSLGGNRYDQMLHYIARDFARFAAQLEVNYMFVWLDWDGDNVLLDPGIIDYGSVRQFGMFHDSYRYDDVDRYSTNITEQRRKARETVQTFAQMVHFLKSGRKSSSSKFRKHWSIKLFEKEFYLHRLRKFLENLGFDENQARGLSSRYPDTCQKLFEANRYFESQKTRRKPLKLPDGIIQPAIFNLRNIWAELPKRLIENEFTPISEVEFFDMMLAQSSTGTDLKYKKNFSKRIALYQECYMDLVEKCRGPWKSQLQKMNTRCAKLDRVTGNGIECVTEEITKAQVKGLPVPETQKVIEALIQNQTPGSRRPGRLILLENPASKTLLEKALRILHDYQEDI